ncbi:MAG: glycosyltransferase family 39 protein, partial [Bdellovibrionaceae bacterium]|nr:glycosyltransferase family 39 protein [Pseudobdellovibrionaceae bacterium]
AFGYTEWAARLPSALSATLFLFVLYLIGLRTGGWRRGLFYVLIAGLNRNVIGYHVGHSADMDALFILGIVVADLFLRGQYVEGLNPRRWWGAALGLVLAFWAKGFTFLILFPGWLFLFRKQLSEIFRDLRFWGASALLALGCGSWLITAALFTHSDPSAKYSATSKVGIMIVYDIFERFWGFTGEEPKPWALLEFLDSRLGGLWYLLILFAAIALIARVTGRGTSALSEKEQKEFLYCSAMFVSLLLILQISVGKNQWYIAPLNIWLPALILSLFKINQKIFGNLFKPIVTGLLAIALVVNLIHLFRAQEKAVAPTTIQQFSKKFSSELAAASKLHLGFNPQQSEYLYLRWATIQNAIKILVTPEMPSCETVKMLNNCALTREFIERHSQ